MEIICECSNAADAVEKISLLNPDLCFLDILMPGKKGIDLLKEIKKPHLEVIIVTGSEQYAIQALRLSAVDYLLKPIDQDKLTLAVRRAKERLEGSA